MKLFRLVAAVSLTMGLAAALFGQDPQQAPNQVGQLAEQPADQPPDQGAQPCTRARAGEICYYSRMTAPSHRGLAVKRR